jgi:hypothetical protein
MYNQDLTDYRVVLAELESLVGLDVRTSGLSKSNRAAMATYIKSLPPIESVGAKTIKGDKE